MNVVNGSNERDTKVEVHASGTGSFSDSVRGSLSVSPAGFPAHKSLAGQLTGRAEIRLSIPTEIVPGSLAVSVRAYPSPLADVMSGAKSILREPHGCFEQASATNYPNTLAILYLRENQIDNPVVLKRAHGRLDRGYEKLISFECDEHGFEWFGKDPGHRSALRIRIDAVYRHVTGHDD